MGISELLSATWFVKGVIVTLGYLSLVTSSGYVVSSVLEAIGNKSEGKTVDNDNETQDESHEMADKTEDDDEKDSDDIEQVSKRERDVGQVIGKCENLLVLSFILANAYTALAVVFAAKSIVRREDMVKNSKYYLAGTLVNFTYSILFGLLVSRIVSVVS